MKIPRGYIDALRSDLASGMGRSFGHIYREGYRGVHERVVREILQPQLRPNWEKFPPMVTQEDVDVYQAYFLKIWWRMVDILEAMIDG